MLNLLNFTALVSQMTAAIQGAATALLDMSIGSTLLAVTEGVASVQLWLQWLIILTLQQTRAATSTGAALTSWVADFGLTRIAGTYATGYVTFSRFSYAASSATVAVGALVITGDGTQTFAVVANTGNSFWNGTGYTIPAGTQSGALPVQAVNVGTAANVAANTISQLGQSIPGIDTVNNPAAMTGGVNGETDSALRARFILFINTRYGSTYAAIQYAVTNTPGLVSYSITTNYDPNGAYDPGSFFVVADNGSGVYSSTLVTAVQTAVAAVAGNGIRWSVIGPTLQNVSVSCSITVSTNYTLSAVEALVTTAITNYINSLPVGGYLAYSILISLAYGASPGVENVTGMLLNGGTADVAGGPQIVLRTSSVTVT
jgi:uncharacterized phage protein gp47/JayE